jgi:hypothetical protein
MIATREGTESRLSDAVKHINLGNGYMTNYDRIATLAEVLSMSVDERNALIAKFKLSENTADRWVDHRTFQPFFIMDRVRYDLEPLVDEGLINGFND